MKFHLYALALVVAAGCTSPSSSPRPGQQPVIVPDLPVSHPPFEQVQASWKQRMDVAYVYLEHTGSYTGTGALIPMVHRELKAQGLEPDGPPFALFYDDPARTPVEELRSRACIPIRGQATVRAPLQYEVLRTTTVAYAYASGRYDELARAYPAIFGYMSGMNWERAGPIREVYLVAPGADPDPRTLVSEIQIPARPRTDS